MKGKKPDHGRGTALAASPETQGTQIKGRLWLEKSGETFLSWGRVVLLDRIKETGSIAAPPALWRWLTAMPGPWWPT